MTSEAYAGTTAGQRRAARRWAFDRMGAAAMVYSVRRHRRRRMLELAVGWADR